MGVSWLGMFSNRNLSMEEAAACLHGKASDQGENMKSMTKIYCIHEIREAEIKYICQTQIIHWTI